MLSPPCSRNKESGDSIGIITAGIPNIYGWWQNNNGIEYIATETDNKLFKASTVAGSYNGHSDVGNAGIKMQFSATNYEPIYGNSDTVQPPALQLIPQIKF